MSDATQAVSTLLSHAALTNAATAAGLSVVGTEVDVRTFLSAQIYVYHALVEAAANDPGLQYILQGRGSVAATTHEDWVDLLTFQTGTTAAVSAAISGAEAAGETTIAVGADPTGAFTPGAKVYIQDAGTVADGEWGRVAVSATGSDIVTLVDGLTNAKDGSDFIWTQAETFAAIIDLTGMSYVRMIMQGSDTTGADAHFKAEMVAMTDFE